ncbi:hypothetical protein HU200_032571 [Digitaria exilis]|uniref:Knottins-like domain-containing protein n=1 Tax=Digitaria exilis TaxID=1010633 RepID=A0A835BMI7_9POAL|nr:hypothetical protein HU200_032571 [Digitaria exilis]
MSPPNLPGCIRHCTSAQAQAPRQRLKDGAPVDILFSPVSGQPVVSVHAPSGQYWGRSNVYDYRAPRRPRRVAGAEMLHLIQPVSHRPVLVQSCSTQIEHASIYMADHVCPLVSLKTMSACPFQQHNILHDPYGPASGSVSEMASPSSRRMVASALFVVLLLLILVDRQHSPPVSDYAMAQMGPTRLAEARHCVSQSHKFVGSCMSFRNCEGVCKTEGFPWGECRATARGSASRPARGLASFLCYCVAFVSPTVVVSPRHHRRSCVSSVSSSDLLLGIVIVTRPPCLSALRVPASYCSRTSRNMHLLIRHARDLVPASAATRRREIERMPSLISARGESNPSKLSYNYKRRKKEAWEMHYSDIARSSSMCLCCPVRQMQWCTAQAGGWMRSPVGPRVRWAAPATRRAGCRWE